MSRLLLAAAALAGALALAARPAWAQDSTTVSLCARPDSAVITGNNRVSDPTIRATAGIPPRAQLNFLLVQRALRNLFATGQFATVRIDCRIDPLTQRSQVVIAVEERAVLGTVAVTGTEHVSRDAVRDLITARPGAPLDPADIARSVARIDSLYESKGYYLARIEPDTVVQGGRPSLVFHVDEGRRLAISGIQIDGNKALSDKDIVGDMKTKPEGFLWLHRGEFDEDKLALDLGDRIPALYARHGFIDFQVVQDTLVVDREHGKGLLDIKVDEGKRYHVGTFDVVGNRRFPADVIRRYYPFGDQEPTLTERIKGVLGRGGRNGDVFNQEEWDEATQRLVTAYHNEGYIRSEINPVVERTVAPDSTPVVNLRWEIQEGTPAIINKVIIQGNDYTTEACIRDQIFVLPGDVFSQDRLIQSYQNIANLGFFETPLPPPETRVANDQGDVDIVFHVKERRTGNVNFGASVGQGTGVGGFIGLEQPNLLGKCKRVSLQWQFGRLVNDFQLAYTDPSIKQTRISGTVSAYHSRSRFIFQDLGRTTAKGGTLQFGFPVPGTLRTRLFVSYGVESIDNRGGIFSQDSTSVLLDGFRSTVGLTLTHDDRINLPFPTAGTMQTITAEANGGFLGGDEKFQRVTGEARTYLPLGQLGGGRPGSQPVQFVFGFTARAGAVFGDVGPFITRQKFALGGTQFGEMLRGYKEFCITPDGFDPTCRDNNRARVSSFGSAFFSTTTEFGMRVSQSFYTNLFFDAGNLYDRPRDFDPTRLFRGAGIGVALITPLGPLGLDWAYGFDQVDALGRPDPHWEIHFRIGNLF
ncbi:MAG TPA: outer membrane protein assembly factor BamA [Gemmatimonadaceae bacterium]|nr:outer membrane protein assembly factor BamA [Gemmatimonadaceae bacterium]